MLYEGLVRLKPDGSTEPALANSYEISEDGRIYEFTLREAYWSNGDPICAKDIEISWKRALDPLFANPFRHLFFVILNGEKAAKEKCSISEVGVSALSSKKLRVTLENPSPHFLALISLCNFFPVPPAFETKTFSDPSELPVSGPFRILSWKKRQLLSLRKNHLYWDKNNVVLDEFMIYICNNPYSTMQMFNEGEIDFLSSILCSLPPECLQQYVTQGLGRLIPMGGTVFCSFNTTVFPFHNQNIRSAFTLAINRQELLRDINSFETPAKQFLPPPLAQGSSPHRCVYNPELALQRLHLGMQELGVFSNEEKDQLKVRLFFENLTLCFEHSVPRTKLAHALQKQWSQTLKIHIKLEGLPYQLHLQKLLSGTYSFAIECWLAQYMDPLDILDRFTSKTVVKNIPRFEHSEYSAAVESVKKAIHPPSRLQWIARAEEILFQEAPITPLYHYDHVLIARPSVSGISHLPNGGLRFSNCNPTNVANPYEKLVQVH